MAMEHAHEVLGGWLECDRGYVMSGYECISESEAVEQKVVVTNLPSAVMERRDIPERGLRLLHGAVLLPGLLGAHPRRRLADWVPRWLVSFAMVSRGESPVVNG
jgi:hypothetical protein